MRIATWIHLALASALPVQAAWALGEMPSPLTEQAPWARWQGRITLGNSASPFRLDQGSASFAPRTGIGAVGDYYFSRAQLGASDAGGFRATSGIAFGRRTQIFNALMPATAVGAFGDRGPFGQSAAVGNPLNPLNERATLSYVGLGYSGLSSQGGWSFSADLGLVSLNPGSAVRLGRVFTGSQGVDELAHDLRLAPMLQLGASYAF